MYNIGVKSNIRGVRKGSWTDEEDNLLRKCIEKYGEGNWHRVPQRADLNRCRKSCRLRWMNYLKPNIKRGQFSEDEVDLIIRLHKLLGNRWSLIAGRIPGRTANDVKNYWNTHLHKKLSTSSRPPKHPNTSNNNSNIICRKNNSQQSHKTRPTFGTTTTSITTTLSKNNITMQPQIIKPQPWTFPKSSPSLVTKKPGPITMGGPNGPGLNKDSPVSCDSEEDEDEDEDEDVANAKWWENLVEMDEGNKEEENNQGCNSTSIRSYNNGPDFGLGFQVPGCQGGLNMWPTSFSEVPRSPINQAEEHNVWEDDDLWNFDVNAWENGT